MGSIFTDASDAGGALKKEQEIKKHAEEQKAQAEKLEAEEKAKRHDENMKQGMI